jgi:predicted nucleic acid-binding protein
MYLLDANVFMEANRLYYGFDIAPGFWAWLGDERLAGRVGSIDAVKDEITAGTGDLVDWANALPAAFWLTDTEDVLARMAKLAAWAAHPARHYRQSALDEFLRSADLKLVAHAITSGSTLVTRERSAPESRTKVKIPDACSAVGVACVDPFSAYRALGLRLVA